MLTDRPVSLRPEHAEIVRTILHVTLPAHTRVWVFGSRARGTEKRSADLDLALEAAVPLSRDQMSMLEEAFEESELPYRVDIVDMRTIDGLFCEVVLRERVPFALDPPVDEATDGS